MQGSFDSFDPMSGQRGLNDVADKVMSSLFTEKPANLELSGHVLQGDLADSWEITPDGTQATIKLRQGAKWRWGTFAHRAASKHASPDAASVAGGVNANEP